MPGEKSPGIFDDGITSDFYLSIFQSGETVISLGFFMVQRL